MRVGVAGGVPGFADYSGDGAGGWWECDSDAERDV